MSGREAWPRKGLETKEKAKERDDLLRIVMRAQHFTAKEFGVCVRGPRITVSVGRGLELEHSALFPPKEYVHFSPPHSHVTGLSYQLSDPWMDALLKIAIIVGRKPKYMEHLEPHEDLKSKGPTLP